MKQILLLITVLLFITGCVENIDNDVIDDIDNNVTEEVASSTPLLIIIYDESCLSCVNQSVNLSSGISLIPNEIPEINILKYERGSSEGKSLIEQFEIEFFPFYLYNEEAKTLMESSRLLQEGFSKQEKDGYYLDLNKNPTENRKLTTIPAGNYFDIDNTQKDITYIRYDMFPGNRTFNNKSFDSVVYTFQIIIPLNPQSFREGIYEPLYCAKKQDKYYELANGLVKYEYSLNESNLNKIATDLGINADEFITCCKRQEIKQEIRTISEEVRSTGINGFPTQIINSELVMKGFSEAFLKHYNAIR